jgi:hypothetical protein
MAFWRGRAFGIALAWPIVRVANRPPQACRLVALGALAFFPDSGYTISNLLDNLNKADK